MSNEWHKPRVYVIPYLVFVRLWAPMNIFLWYLIYMHSLNTMAITTTCGYSRWSLLLRLTYCRLAMSSLMFLLLLNYCLISLRKQRPSSLPGFINSFLWFKSFLGLLGPNWADTHWQKVILSLLAVRESYSDS